ncbi:Calmodulin-binding transcription activator 5 [Acorus calamus]|uniref:Calmodulin-binding transcription activator 5 n=1 Tax=Acorus calamus TaxID=4465 RepID=A0AAV9F2P4_ACOCL|nr:Calmodulin-binding transcription activator 5 [Acorus calamus]
MSLRKISGALSRSFHPNESAMETTNQSQLAGLDIHGFRTMEDLDVEKLMEDVTTRWLRTNEIHAILFNHDRFDIQAKPHNLPKSGTILLFDRKVLRNFRKDGHNWKKKKDGKTVQEAHEHLKVGNEERIHVYYARNEDNPNFYRRSYWLLDKKLEHIVLVHYRDTTEDNTFPPPAATTEGKEALPLTQLGSPATPVNSSGSSHSVVSGSMALSEEIDSGADFRINAGESVRAMDYVQRIHELNTLDWAELVEPPPSSVDIPASGKDGVPYSDDTQHGLYDTINNEGVLPYHGLPQSASTIGHSNDLLNENGSSGVGQPVCHSEASETYDNGIFQTQNSFGRMMSFIVEDSPGSLDEDLQIDASLPYSNDSDVVQTMDKSPILELVFSIADISPGWAYSTEETKVIVIGKFCDGCTSFKDSNFFFIFGNLCSPAERVQEGVFRCTAPQHTPGIVNFYLSLDGSIPISQVLNFEYRSISTTSQNNYFSSPQTSDFSSTDYDNTNWENIQYQIRLIHLLFTTTSGINLLSSKISPNLLKEAKKLSSLTNVSLEKNWAHLLKSIENHDFSVSFVHQNLFEMALKNKLQEWLIEKVAEGCKKPILDKKGQGVIHLCAILGYAWAIYPFKISGLSLDFRDAHGWTALHWAAFYGREKMVAVLLSAGANPSLVSDPTPECPGGCTAADLASQKGYEGLAAYLAEKGLTAHFEAMTLSGNVTGPQQPIGTDNTDPYMVPQNLTEDDLCLKDSLAAYRNAADAASRIQTAFRERMLKQQMKEIQLVEPEKEAQTIISAMRIQHAYRNYNARKRMAAAARIQHGFRTWKIRREFLNKRRLAIKIQSVYRGHLIRRQYRKILWSVGVLEKALLRWRKKRKGLRGVQGVANQDVMLTQEQANAVEDDFFKISQKQAEERVTRSVVRVQSMFRSYKAQQEYRRMKLTHDQAKMEFNELLEQ